MQQELIFPDARKGYSCPCCNSFIKTYARRFNVNMSLALLLMYRKKEKGFIKVEDVLLSEGYKRCGDFTYLRHYSLIEKMEGKRDDNSNRNGFYKITPKGELFAENKMTVQDTFLTFQNKLKGFEGNEISIKQALSIKFNYDELMGNI